MDVLADLSPIEQLGNVSVRVFKQQDARSRSFRLEAEHNGARRAFEVHTAYGFWGSLDTKEHKAIRKGREERAIRILIAEHAEWRKVV